MLSGLSHKSHDLWIQEKKLTQYQCKQQLRSKQAVDLMCINKGAQPMNIYISCKRV